MGGPTKPASHAGQGAQGCPTSGAASGRRSRPAARWCRSRIVRRADRRASPRRSLRYERIDGRPRPVPAGVRPRAQTCRAADGGVRVQHLVDAAHALAVAGQDRVRRSTGWPAGVPGWSGGTRIGESLSEFIAKHPDLVGGRTVIVIVSDGLDRGDTALVAAAMRDAQRESAADRLAESALGRPAIRADRARHAGGDALHRSIRTGAHARIARAAAARAGGVIHGARNLEVVRRESVA